MTIKAASKEIKHLNLEQSLCKDNLEELKNVLLSQMRENRDLSLDLSNVIKIDSMGLGILVVIYKKITSSGGLFQIVNPTADVIKLLELTQLDKKFNVVYS